VPPCEDREAVVVSLDAVKVPLLRVRHEEVLDGPAQALPLGDAGIAGLLYGIPASMDVLGEVSNLFEGAGGGGGRC
jgi:hypothetical protein